MDNEHQSEPAESQKQRNRESYFRKRLIKACEPEPKSNYDRWMKKRKKG